MCLSKKKYREIPGYVKEVIGDVNEGIRAKNLEPMKFTQTH